MALCAFVVCIRADDIPPWRKVGLGSFLHMIDTNASHHLRILSEAQSKAFSPEQCESGAGVVAMSLWWSGLGATLNALGKSFCAAHSRGEVIWLKEERGTYITSWKNGWRWFYDEKFCPHPVTLNCFIQPLSPSCSNPSSSSHSSSELPLIPPRPPSLLSSRDCLSVFLPYFLRPSSRLQLFLFEEYDKYWSNFPDLTHSSRRNMIALHIRWGDKIIDNDLLPISAYMEKVIIAITANKLSSPIILLSSEDQFAIDMFISAASQQPILTERNTTILFYRYSRPYYQCGQNKSILASSRQSKVGRRIPYGCNALQLTTGSDSMILVSLANLFISSEAPTLICMIASNWCSLLEQLRVFFHRPGTVSYLL